MGFPEFYNLEAGLLFGLVVALGLGVRFYHRPSFTIVRICSWVAAALFVSIAIVWGTTSKESPWVWMPTVAAVGAIGAVLLTAALRAVSNVEAEGNAPVSETTKGQ